MRVANTQINRIYQRKHEILKIWEDGARVFCLGHSNADFVHLIQQAEFFKNMLLMAAQTNKYFILFSICENETQLNKLEIFFFGLFFDVIITILLKADLLSIIL